MNNLKEGIWFMDMTGVIEKEKTYRIYEDKDGELHITATDGNTYGTSRFFWEGIQKNISVLDEKQSQEAARRLLKMLKCKLYMELSMIESKTTNEITLERNLYFDKDIREITGRS